MDTRQVLGGLACLHVEGIIYQDIRLENVLISRHYLAGDLSPQSAGLILLEICLV